MRDDTAPFGRGAVRCGLAALLAALAALPAPAAAGDLPRAREDLLFVGDSVTAGVYFMALSDSSAAQAWPADLTRALGFELPPARFPEAYPLDLLTLVRKGFGLGGWRFPWSAVPALLPRHPRFAPAEPRSVVAVPGQTVTDYLHQSSVAPGQESAGWIFASLILPRGWTAIETVQRNPIRPRWVLAFLGSNDLLIPFGMVGAAEPLRPDVFAQRYGELASKLFDAMAPGTPPAHLLLATLPDVTVLPFLQPVPEGAVDARGRALPAGTRVSAFLLPFRRHRFDADEAWTPGELDALRRDGRAYNDSIRAIAARHGFTVLDIDGLLAELAADPTFTSPASPYFSPDLHHPSALTHRRIADLALATMAEVAGTPDPPISATPAPARPAAADLTPAQTRRTDALMRIALLSMEKGALRPTWRGTLESVALSRPGRAGSSALAGTLALEGPPGPFTTRWDSRGTLALRAELPFDRNGTAQWTRRAFQYRAGIAMERLGQWRWLHGEFGLRGDVVDRAGWYVRAEWRPIVVETGSRDFAPDELRAGLQFHRTWGRPGHGGN